MANKTFNTRVKNKRDTAANWEAVATTFQPLDGELIIVDTSVGKTRFKVGRYDTAKGRLLYYNEIPFADEYLYNDLNESQGKIYDKLKGIDDKSIIESTLEPVAGADDKLYLYNIGLWQFPKTGFYKIKLAKVGALGVLLKLYARITKDDGTTPDDWDNYNLKAMVNVGGYGLIEEIYAQVDYINDDKFTVYRVQFFNCFGYLGSFWVNTYDKTTQKWAYEYKHRVTADHVSNHLTLTKGDVTTKFNGSTAQTVSIPTKTSELTNDSNFTTQTDLDNLINTVISYNAQENITDEQKATARTNIGATFEPFKVTLSRTYGKPYLDKTPKEINDAYTAGKYVYLKEGFSLLPLTYAIHRDDEKYTISFSGTCKVSEDSSIQVTSFSVIKVTPDYSGQWTENYKYNIDAKVFELNYNPSTQEISGNNPYNSISMLNNGDQIAIVQLNVTGNKFYLNQVATISNNTFIFQGFADDALLMLRITSDSMQIQALRIITENNIEDIVSQSYVAFYTEQSLSDEEKKQARNNIGIKNPFKVTFTRSYGKVSADKTAKEIKDAANSGQFVYGIFDGDPANIYTLSVSYQNDIRFNRLYTETDSNMGLCYNVFYINNPTDDFKGNYEETYCYNITAPSIRIVKVMLDNGTYKFDSTGAGTSYSEIFNMCKTSNNNNYTNSDVFLAQGNKLYKLDQNPWSMTIPLVFKRVSYDSTTSSILFETFTINTDSTITYESNTFEQNSTQSDWNENDTSSPAYIQNKPNIPIVDLELSTTSTNPVQNKAVKTAIDSLQASIGSKIDITTLNYGLTQVTNDVAANYVKFTAEQTLTDEQKAQARENINAPSPADAVYTATAASTDGVAYTATVSGIDSLTVGASFIMIPNKASTSKAPTLNVNGLGAKPIRRRLSSLTTSLQQGYSTNWIALNKPFTVVYDGTAWVIEGLTKTDGADVYGAVAQATADAKGNNIADTYATIAMLQSMLPKVTTITLTSNWVGDASPYYQDIALSCVTETSIVDLQPTPEQLNSWQDDGIAFTTLSGNGTVRVYVAGGKPSSAISVQVRVQEVTVI